MTIDDRIEPSGGWLSGACTQVPDEAPPLPEVMMEYIANASFEQLAELGARIMAIVNAAPGWDCEAYGPRGTEIGALCFVANPHERACQSRAECSATMYHARERLHARVHENAASDGPDGVWTYLARELGDDPQRLLNAGGGDDDDESRA